MKSTAKVRILCGWLGWVCVGAGLAPTAAADLTVFVAALSDYVYRGLSQSDSGPALQAGVSVEHENGLFTSGWVSNVEFEFESFASRPRELEVDLVAGYAWQPSENWGLTTQLRHYWFPDSSIDYDYTEVSAQASYRSGVFSVGWIEDLSGGPAWTYELAGSRALVNDLMISAGAGWFDGDGLLFVPDYAYWSVTLERSFGRYGGLLGVYGTDSRARQLLGSDSAGTRVVLGATVSLWPWR